MTNQDQQEGTDTGQEGNTADFKPAGVNTVDSPSTGDRTPCTVKSIVVDTDHQMDNPAERVEEWQGDSLRLSPMGECHIQCQQTVDSQPVRLLKEFCDCTSAHGFHKIFQSSSILHRVIWMLIIISATVGFTVHLCFLISRFFLSPVNTETQVYSTQFVFPDVTICSTSHFSQIRFARNPRVDGSANETVSQLIERIRRYWDPGNPSENNSAINADLRNSLKSYLHLVSITKKKQDMIVHCRYTGSPCSYRDFSEYADPEYTSCYTFSPENRHLIVGGEKDGGLILILYGDDGKNFITEEESLSFSTGFRVVIHEQGTRPNMMEGFYIQKGTNTYAQLAYTMETVLSKKGRLCTEDKDLPNIEFIDCYGNQRSYKYSIADCSMYRYQDYLNKTCKCLSEMIPLPAIYRHQMSDFREKFCHRIPHGEAEEREAESDRGSNNSRRECHDRAVQTIHNLTAADRTNCSISCTNLMYEMRLTQNKWPSENGEATRALLKSVEDTASMAQQDGLDYSVLEEMRQLLQVNEPDSGIHSFLKLNIYSHSTMGNMIVESWAYPARNLFSDIGGILGLWLGVSIISTFEFLELMLSMANTWRQGRRESRLQWSMESKAGATAEAEKLTRTNNRHHATDDTAVNLNASKK